MTPEPHDLVVAHLADEGADLRARLAECEAERQTLAELLSESLSLLHEKTETERRQSRTIESLRNELRRYTAGLFTVDSSERAA